MIKIGVTGSIGSGKTLVCKMFEILGAPVYYSDIRAREIIETNKSVVLKVRKLFGRDVYDKEGKLKRKVLSDIVFYDKKKLAAYNAIVHPVVMQDAELWIQEHKHAAYIIKESALLFEAGIDKKLDFTICITAPQSLRIKRVMERDNSKRSEVLARMHNQWSQQKKLAHALFHITNDGKQLLAPQVHDLHLFFLHIHKHNLLAEKL
jgi:dephospho-CoA kinase